MNERNPNIASRVLSVRVPETIYRAYEQIQANYNFNQTDLVRIAPLLLVLLAEGRLAGLRKEVAKKEKKIQELQEAQKISWTSKEFQEKYDEFQAEKIALNDYELKGDFIHLCRELAEKTDNKDVIDPKNIQPGKGDLPEYRIYQIQLLRQAAQEIVNEKVAPEEVQDLKIPFNNPYDGQLLCVGAKKLGKEQLDDEEKDTLRQEFQQALAMRQEFHGWTTDNKTDEASISEKLKDATYEFVCDRVRLEDVSDLLFQIGSKDPPVIPRRYDGQLLAISRGKIGKPLNAREKAEVRRIFREALRKFREIAPIARAIGEAIKR